MNSFIGWIGGKRLLRNDILARFPKENIDRYIEVCGGAGWVLFAKEYSSKQLEVFNDYDGDLINLYRCVKYHCTALQDELEWLLSSREQFCDCLAQVHMQGLTDIQRAARFFYLIKISFGSNGYSFATSSKSIESAKEYLSKIQARLKGVVIEQKDCVDLIKIYDRPTALFYIDPPYVGTEKHYNVKFGAEDHARLADALKAIKGKFILSYGDDPLVWQLYDGFKIERVYRNSTLAAHGSNSDPFAEVIISNF